MKNLIIFIIIIFMFSCKKNKTKNNNYSINKTSVKVDALANNQIKKNYPFQYIKIQPDSTKIDYKMDSLNISKSIWINNIQIITCTINDNKNGIHLIVKNNIGNILFKSKGQQDSWRYNPNLFKSKEGKKIIIISEIGDEESWGIYIQEYDKGIYKEIGSIDIVALNEYDESLNIIPFIKVKELNDDVLKFYFDEKIKIFDIETEKIFLGKKLIYKYKNGKIVMLK